MTKTELHTNIFTHSGNMGDVLAAIPALLTYYEKNNKKVHLKLIENVPAHYYQGAVHPTKDATGKDVMLNQKMIEMLTPLLLAQECIGEVSTIQHDDVIADPDYKTKYFHLEWIRETNVGMPALCINRWYFYVFPDLSRDLTKPWLSVPDADKDFAKGKIIISRSERYRNPSINYEFLKKHEDECVFIGTIREWNQFCMAFDLQIEKLKVDNFLELAQAIKQSRFHITNQTMANQISTGIVHPAILETCTFAPNCIINGPNRYDFLSQMGLEFYFNELYKLTK